MAWLGLARATKHFFQRIKTRCFQEWADYCAKLSSLYSKVPYIFPIYSSLNLKLHFAYETFATLKKKKKKKKKHKCLT